MFFDFLQSRSMEKQFGAASQSLAAISSTATKIEEIVSGIYRHVDKEGAVKALGVIDLEQKAREFMLLIAAKTTDRRFLNKEAFDPSASFEALWYEFLCNNGFFEVSELAQDMSGDKYLIYLEQERIAKIHGSKSKLEATEFEYLQGLYEAFRLLNPNKRGEVARPHLWQSRGSIRSYVESLPTKRGGDGQ